MTCRLVHPPTHLSGHKLDRLVAQLSADNLASSIASDFEDSLTRLTTAVKVHQAVAEYGMPAVLHIRHHVIVIGQHDSCTCTILDIITRLVYFISLTCCRCCMVPMSSLLMTC